MNGSYPFRALSITYVLLADTKDHEDNVDQGQTAQIVQSDPISTLSSFCKSFLQKESYIYTEEHTISLYKRKYQPRSCKKGSSCIFMYLHGAISQASNHMAIFQK